MPVNSPAVSSRYSRNGYLIAAVISVLAVLSISSLGGYVFAFDTEHADIKNDWVVGSALIAGENPYGDLVELADRFSKGGYTPPKPDPEFDGANRTPRTPGAIATSVLWTPVSLQHLVSANNLLGVLMLIPMIFLVIRNEHHPAWLLVSVPIVCSMGMLWSLRFSTITPFVALATTYAIVSIRNGGNRSSGIVLALAATTKAFPIVILLLAVAYRRWRTVYWAIACLAVLNLTPLLLPRLRVGDALDALTGASGRYGYLVGNMSFGMFISDTVGSNAGALVLVGAVGATAWWVITKPTNVPTDSALLVGSAILLTPLSWPHYAVVFYPLALMFILAPTTGHRIKAVAAASLLFAIPSPQPWSGALGILIVVVLAGIGRTTLLSRPPQPLSAPLSTPQFIRGPGRWSKS